MIIKKKLKNDKNSIIAEEFKITMNHSFCDLLRNYSVPVGTRIKIIDDCDFIAKNRIKRKTGKIIAFRKNNIIVVEFEDKEIHEIPSSCISLILDNKESFFKRFVCFFRNMYRIRKLDLKNNEKKSKGSIKNYYKIFSLPIGTKIRIVKKESDFISKGVAGKIGKIESFKNDKYVLVEIEDEGIFEVSYNNIEVLINNNIGICRRIHNFIVNRFLSANIE